MEIVRLNNKYYLNIPVNTKEIRHIESGEILQVINMQIERYIDGSEGEKSVSVNVLHYQMVNKRSSDFVVGSFMSMERIPCEKDSPGYELVKE